jgi:hypothetical protein
LRKWSRHPAHPGKILMYSELSVPFAETA